MDALNKVASNTFLPRKALTELTVGEKYMVSKMKEVKTKYGQRIVMELESEFQVFLPIRVATVLLNDEQLFFSLCDKINKYELVIKYLGASNIEFMNE